jgi:hypothetical protein
MSKYLFHRQSLVLCFCFQRQLEIDADLEKSKYDSDLKRMQIVHEALKEQVSNDIPQPIPKHLDCRLVQHEIFDTRSISRTDSNLEATMAQQRSRRSSGGQDAISSFAFERSPVRENNAESYLIMCPLTIVCSHAQAKCL